MNDGVVAHGLTKRYGKTVALDRCSFAIPAHTIVALVGPNGAGKSTLLHCATGLVHPTEGTITVLGGPAGDRTLPRVGFVAQDAPLYRDFTANELLTMGDKLNREFDLSFARARLVDVGIPFDGRMDRLSGGQRAQVALCLALAKRPGLLLLDEPLASLDPLARREFLSALMDAVAEEPMTVVLSSHLIADLERVCDHLMVLRSGQVQTFGATDELLATHKLLVGPSQRGRPKLAGVEQIVSATKAERQMQLLVRTSGEILDPAWDQYDISLEDLVLVYLAERAGEPLLDLEAVGAGPGSCGGSTANSSFSPRPGSSCSLRSSWAPAARSTTGSIGLASPVAYLRPWRRPVVVDLAASVPATPGPAPALPEGVDKPPEPTTPALDDATLANARCVQDARAFFDDYQNVIFVGLLLLILPMLVGMFWGAPLIAREIEDGTHRLVWAQGISRLRWATTKVGLVSVAVLVITAIYAGMLTWWITPVVQTSGQRFSYIFFDIHGIVVFGYVVFALALGVFAGAVTGRLLPAMATTVVGFIGVRVAVMLAARDHYLPTETRRLPELDTAYSQMRNDLNGDWIVASRTAIDRVECPAGAGDCAGQGLERSYELLTIHPARHFWTFQAIETAIFAVLAIGLLIGAIHWTRRRVT